MTEREKFEQWLYANSFSKLVTIREKTLMLQAWQAATKDAPHLYEYTGALSIPVGEMVIIRVSYGASSVPCSFLECQHLGGGKFQRGPNIIESDNHHKITHWRYVSGDSIPTAPDGDK